MEITQSFILRIADTKDTKLLSELGKICFLEAFGKDNSEEDLKNYLEESFKEEEIKSELENKNISYLIAVDENNEYLYNRFKIKFLKGALISLVTIYINPEIISNLIYSP